MMTRDDVLAELQRLTVGFAERQTSAVRDVAAMYGDPPPIEERIRLLEWRLQDAAVALKDVMLLVAALAQEVE